MRSSRNAGWKWDRWPSISRPSNRHRLRAVPSSPGRAFIDVNDAARWHWKFPLLLVENVKGFNLVGYRNRVIAIPQSGGAFDQQRVDRGGYSAVFIGESVQEVVRAVKAAQR